MYTALQYFTRCGSLFSSRVFFVPFFVFLTSLYGIAYLGTLFHVDKDEKNFIPPNQARNFRKEANLSQSDVAFLLDIKNSGRISEWENGLSNPSIAHLFMLSLIYQRLPDQIYRELRKGLAEKLAVRYKLLQELKDKKRMRRDEGG